MVGGKWFKNCPWWLTMNSQNYTSLGIIMWWNKSGYILVTAATVKHCPIISIGCIIRIIVLSYFLARDYFKSIFERKYSTHLFVKWHSSKVVNCEILIWVNHKNISQSGIKRMFKYLKCWNECSFIIFTPSRLYSPIVYKSSDNQLKCSLYISK